MEFFGVLLAAGAGFASGAVWYGMLGRRWMAAVGMTEAEHKANASALPYLIAGIGALVTAGMLRHVFAATGIAGGVSGLVAGFGVGAFLVAPWILTNYAFADRPRALWWIDAGHTVLACTVIGLVLGLVG